jgi:peptide/nickel transport system ATP-binding protein/oligopeptide transport system ATP-binding protein
MKEAINDIILEVKGLKTHFKVEEGYVPAVDGVDFTLTKKETLAIVGESGSGKSVTALSILRLIPNPPGRIVAGDIIYNGNNLLDLPEKEMRKIRGNEISMIFQEPMTSLNPVFTVGKQITEVLRIHQKLNKKDAKEKAIRMIKLVGIPNPEKCIEDYPHQLSGGMRQRIMIAIALACNPKVLIADEPTTALDVTIQSQILKLMVDLKEKLDTSIILITHDLGVVAQLAENVMVMYAGKPVEYADTKSLFKNPLHPYTVGLLNSIPKITEENKRLRIIRGTVPSPLNLPKGCKFCTRCDEVKDICIQKEPDYISLEDGRKVKCWKYLGDEYYG